MALKPEINKQLLNFVLFFFFALAILGTAFIVYYKFDPLTIPSYYLILSQILLGLFILINNPANQINLYFFHFLLFMATWNFLASIIIHSPLDTPMFWGDWYVYVAAVLMTLFLMFFTMVFPQRKPYFTQLSKVLFLVLPLFIIVSILISHEYIISGIILERGIRTPLPGSGYNTFVFYIIFYIGLVVFNLVQSYLRAGNLEKLRLFYLLIGALISISGFMITNLFLPIMGVADLEWMGAWFTLIFAAFTAYAITKHHLLDISIVISRFFAELITIAIHASFYLLFVWGFLAYVGTTISWVFLTLTIIFGIFVGQTHHNLRVFIQTTSDKLFLRGKYNYYRELSDATTRVGEKMSLTEILKVLYSTFYNVVEISDPKIYLPEYFSELEKRSTCYQIYDRENFAPQPNSCEVLADSPLVAEMLKKRGPLFDVKEIDSALVVPCILESRLIGFFALGRKLSEDAYTDEDLRLLQVLANQAAMALDHTRSYEKIRNELEAVERQLERSQRLASLGTLTAGVTHEIRNPLTVIRGETERLVKEPRDIEYLKNFRELLLRHIDRISGIVNRMLDLAKEKAKERKPVDLNEMIEASLTLISFGKVKLEKEMGEIPRISGDPEALQEVFLNLFQNAIEAMPQGGKIMVKTFQENNRVVVEVSDTGKGIPADLREKIFDPFFSTRHEGVGLGLSIVYRIIREHDGDISVDSEVGKGSTFRLTF
ncbi:MAG: GAF domain-containing protein [Candidatus Margulisbacteria bacterium]|nr:GAF domain-containing protein [Candidatus Margulisiibacteriota bacterium]